MGAFFIALIYKKEGVVLLKDFRPISFIGSLYKILAIVLAIAHECIDSRFRHHSPKVVSKLDFEKAYDMVARGILQYVMSRMGFGKKWQGQIKSCVSTAHFSILINGTPKG